MSSSAASWYWLFNETRNKLDSLAARVREGKDLDAALEFSRYVTNSRLCDLLDENAAKGPLPCNGKVIRRKAESLTQKVQLRFATRDTKPHVEISELEEINRKLGELSAAVSGHSTRGQVVAFSGEPAPEFLKLLKKESHA
jgi:hypothetical protein